MPVSPLSRACHVSRNRLEAGSQRAYQRPALSGRNYSQRYFPKRAMLLDAAVCHCTIHTPLLWLRTQDASQLWFSTLSWVQTWPVASVVTTEPHSVSVLALQGLPTQWQSLMIVWRPVNPLVLLKEHPVWLITQWMQCNFKVCVWAQANVPEATHVWPCCPTANLCKPNSAPPKSQFLYSLTILFLSSNVALERVRPLDNFGTTHTYG